MPADPPAEVPVVEPVPATPPEPPDPVRLREVQDEVREATKLRQRRRGVL